jgi:hypothetical protein
MTCSEALEMLRNLAVEYAPLLKGLAIGSAAFFIITPAAAPILVVLMPEDALLRRRASTRKRPLSAKVAIILWHVMKNLLGAALMVLGFVLLFLPGQGLLTLFAGVLLADLPGRRTLLARLLGTGKIRPTVDRLRARYGKKALIYPAGSSGTRQGGKPGGGRPNGKGPE